MTGRSNGAVTLPLVLATAMTSWFALWSWGGFVAGSSIYLVPLVLGIPLVSAAGFVARWLRMPIVVVVAAQLLTILLFANLVWGTSPLPTGGSVREAAQAFADSLETLRTYAAPVPKTVTQVAPVLVLGGLVCHLLVDLCAVTLARVPIAGLPLLVVYTLPVSILDKQVSWIAFVLTVIGFLMMLTLQEGGRISRWGRQFGAAPGASGFSAFGPTDARRHPVAVGATATALAVFLPLVIPTLDLQFGGGGSGPGSGDREVRISNPMTDLKRDLVQGPDVPLGRITTSGPAPTYIRMSVLSAFNEDAWTPGDRDLPESHAARGEMPRPVGLTDAYPTTTRPWDVSLTNDLKSLWLPTPMYVAAIQAGNEWRYDDEFLDFHSANDDIDTAGLSYQLTELIPQFNGQKLSEAGVPASSIANRYTSLPGNVPKQVEDIAKEVTQGLPSDYERVQALQNYFRSEFEYDTSVRPGNGNNALVEFLDDRSGYCEQFASALAVMARVLKIPARVAVGFHDAEEVSPGVYEFSTHDLHAWPEIYFDEAGWVKFEPTPAAHISSVPGYTDDSVSEEEPTNLPSNAPSSEPTERPTSSAQPSATPQEQAEQDNGTDDEFSLAPFLWTGGGLVVLVVLLITPRMLRQSRRTRRLQGTGSPAEAAWAELRDTALDLALPWARERSPRETGRALLDHLGPAEGTDTAERPVTGPEANPEATQALVALVEAVERERYAADPEPAAAQQLRAHLDTCVSSLRGGVPRRVRRRATWLPASVLSPARAGRTETRQREVARWGQPSDRIV